MSIIFHKEVSISLAGGAAAQVINIDIPEGVRMFRYAFWITGAGNVLSNRGDLQIRIKTDVIDLSAGFSVAASFFTTVVTGSGGIGSGISGLAAGFFNSFRWIIQPNAVTLNTFTLILQGHDN